MESLTTWVGVVVITVIGGDYESGAVELGQEEQDVEGGDGVDRVVGCGGEGRHAWGLEAVGRLVYLDIVGRAFVVKQMLG